MKGTILKHLKSNKHTNMPIIDQQNSNLKLEDKNQQKI